MSDAAPDTVSTPATRGAAPGAGMLGRIRRVGGYAMWSALAVALPLAVDRLVVAPRLELGLGKELFGAFQWVLGVTYLLSFSVGAGFSNYLMRDLARHGIDDARLIFKTAVIACGSLGAASLLIGGALSLQFADGTVRTHAAPLYGTLGVFGLASCVQWVLVTNLRMRRRFVTMFALKMVETAVLLTLAPLAGLKNLWIIGGVYCVSVVAPLAMNAHLSREVLSGAAWWSTRSAAAMLAIWPVMGVATLIEMSLQYSPRIVLGVYNVAEVTTLFMASSIAAVFGMPVTLVAHTVMSVLSGHRGFVLGGRVGLVYGLAVTVAAVGVAGAIAVAGPMLVTLLYAERAGAAATLFPWLALGGGGSAVTVLMRPVAMKYARVSHVALLASTTLAVEVVLLILLVPSAGALGAARATAAAGLLGAAMWSICFVALRKATGSRELGEAAPAVAGL